jgi:tetratricopeptide (TPR) repeat protein
MYFNARLLVLITLLNWSTPAIADEHWPYLNSPKTSFSSVLGPGAVDASLIIDGRPIFFNETDEEAREKVNKVLQDAKQILNKQQIFVVSTDLEYLEVVDYVLGVEKDAQFKRNFRTGEVIVIYDPPNKDWGKEKIALNGLLASASRRAGDSDTAIVYMLESLEKKKSIYGLKSNPVARQLIDLACLYQDVGKSFDSEKSFNSALEINREIHGKSSKEAASTLMQLANLYFSVEQTNKAQTAKSEAQSIMRGLPEEITERPIPEAMNGALYSWTEIFNQISRLSIYSHLQKIERVRAWIEEGTGNKIAEKNKAIFGTPPNLHLEELDFNGGSGIEFLGGRSLLIHPSMVRYDGKEVPRQIPGTYSIDQTGKITVITQFDGSVKADRWQFSVSNTKLGEAHLTPIQVSPPYPTVRLTGRKQ